MQYPHFSLIRANSKVNGNVEVSLQPCLVSQNRKLLSDHIDRYKGEKKIQHLKALRYIWDSLIAEIDGSPLTYMSFAECYDVYLAFSDYQIGLDQARDNENLKKSFKTLVLHPSFFH